MAEVIVYATAWCPYCHAAKRLLTEKGVAFTEVDVTGRPAERAEMARLAQGRTTVPQIFIDGTPIGGYDDLAQLEDSGALDSRLGCA